LFAPGNSDALIGYSERLNPILSHAGRTVGELDIASATLGEGDEPTLFTDALVMSPRCSSERCRKAAKKFAAYYVSDEVFEEKGTSRVQKKEKDGSHIREKKIRKKVSDFSS
jgi:thiamine pyridinylase